jgi:ligand-binding sensor domain-containing protein/serine phosphatase RsbU (regulator of sigma subunit)
MNPASFIAQFSQSRFQSTFSSLSHSISPNATANNAPPQRLFAVAVLGGWRRVRVWHGFVVLFVVLTILALLTLLAAPETARAQRYGVSTMFERLGRDQGLSESSVTALVQDKRGFLWVGTQNGLNRYDGYGFTVFRQDPNDSLSLSNSNIRALHEDASGTLWVGTQNGLNRFNRPQVAFDRFRNNPNLKNSLSSDEITAIASDNAGNIWVGTRRGVNRFTPATGAWKLYKARKRRLADGAGAGSGTSSGTGLSDNDITALYFEADAHRGNRADSAHHRANAAHGRLWIGTRTGGLHLLFTDTDEIISFRNNDADAKTTAETGINSSASSNANSGENLLTALTDNAIACITGDAFGRIWVGTRTSGLHRVSYDDRKRSSSKPSSGLSVSALTVEMDGLSDNFIRAVLATPDGTVFAGTRSGLTVLSGSERDTFTNSADNARTLSDNDITALYQDRSGVIWVGTASAGLNKLVPRSSQFSIGTVRVSRSERDIASSGIVTGFLTSRSKALGGATLIASNGGVLAVTFGRSGTFSQSSVVLDIELGNLSDSHVTSLLEDRTNPDVLWVGTENGLNQYSHATKRTRFFRHKPDDPTSLGDDFINCLYQDRAGVLWVGTSGGGLSRFNAQSQSFTTFRHNAMDSSSLADNFVFTMLEDSRGALWVGTGGGLSRLDEASGTFVHATQRDNEPQSLSNNSVLSLYEDSRGALWVGTFGGGLNVIDAAQASALAASIPAKLFKPRFLRFSERNGLPSDAIFSIVEDAQKRLWVSTGRGLVRLTRSANAAVASPAQQSAASQPAELAAQFAAQFALRVYDVNDGLPGNEFRKGAGYRAPSGHLMFGVANGFMFFHPDSLRDNPHAPPVVLTAFKKFNQVVPLDTSITEASELLLDHTDNTISFEFAALDFSNPSKNQYSYRLEGFDDRWIQLGSDHVVRFTSLDAGKYTLRIRASNSDGTWNDAGITLPIVIHPPWWGTWWFHLNAALMAGFVLWSAFRWRVRAIEQQSKRLASLVDARTEEIAQKSTELATLLGEAEQARRDTEHAYALLEQEHSRKTFELEEARALQLSMLPTSTPNVKGLDVAFLMRTATEVGGDYYDYSLAPDGTLTLAVGDATGHGVRAGMLVSIVKSNFHALADSIDVAGIAGQIGRNIKRMRLQKMFMCLTILRYSQPPQAANNSAPARLELSGAGMPPTLVFRAATGEVESVRQHGIVLGAVLNFEYPTQTLALHRGDVVLVMSDGLVELFNAQREELGTERITACFQRVCSTENTDESANSVLTALNTLADEWMSGVQQNDDIALVVLRAT